MRRPPDRPSSRQWWGSTPDCSNDWTSEFGALRSIAAIRGEIFDDANRLTSAPAWNTNGWWQESFRVIRWHYDDVIMGAMASQITSLMIVYLNVYSGADQSKHQSSASLAFVWGIPRGLMSSPHKWPVTGKMFPFDDVIMKYTYNQHTWRVCDDEAGRGCKLLSAQFLGSQKKMVSKYTIIGFSRGAVLKYLVWAEFHKMLCIH